MIRKAIIVLLTLGAVAIVGLSLACYWFPVEVGYYDGDGQHLYTANAGGGALGLMTRTSILSLSVEGRPRIVAWALGDHEFFLRFGRASYGWTETGLTTVTYSAIPAWVVAAVSIAFATYPTVAFIRGPLRRRHRRRKGLCIKCGYNLTGLPKPRCPECGKPI